MPVIPPRNELRRKSMVPLDILILKSMIFQQEV